MLLTGNVSHSAIFSEKLNPSLKWVESGLLTMFWSGSRVLFKTGSWSTFDTLVRSKTHIWPTFGSTSGHSFCSTNGPAGDAAKISFCVLFFSQKVCRGVGVTERGGTVLRTSQHFSALSWPVLNEKCYSKNLWRPLKISEKLWELFGSFWKGWKDPHPQDFIRKRPVLLRATFVLTKDRKRPYYGHFCDKMHREGSCSKAAGRP